MCCKIILYYVSNILRISCLSFITKQITWLNYLSILHNFRNNLWNERFTLDLRKKFSFVTQIFFCLKGTSRVNVCLLRSKYKSVHVVKRQWIFPTVYRLTRSIFQRPLWRILTVTWPRVRVLECIYISLFFFRLRTKEFESERAEPKIPAGSRIGCCFNWRWPAPAGCGAIKLNASD